MLLGDGEATLKTDQGLVGPGDTYDTLDSSGALGYLDFVACAHICY